MIYFLCNFRYEHAEGALVVEGEIMPNPHNRIFIEGARWKDSSSDATAFFRKNHKKISDLIEQEIQKSFADSIE